MPYESNMLAVTLNNVTEVEKAKAAGRLSSSPVAKIPQARLTG